jgi:hypothetical protein
MAEEDEQQRSFGGQRCDGLAVLRAVGGQEFRVDTLGIKHRYTHLCRFC